MLVTSTDQRREARDPKTSSLRLLFSSRRQVLRNLARLKGPNGNSLTLSIQYRDPNWNICWSTDTNRFHFNGSTSTKTSNKRREGGPHVAPLLKSRLVSRGDLEETTGVRTDSPTCDIEGLNILLSWVSCERLTVKSGDITNAYFQGCPLERLILMRQPLGGVPDVDVSADTMFVARVPIYGTCDAGRGLWKKLRHDILSTGLKENAVLRALVHIPRRRRTQIHACDSCR